MTPQAYFERIEEQLLEELDSAKEQIVVAVAWFTNEPLFRKLCEKCRQGVSVELMVLDDDINNTSNIDLNRLNELGGRLYKIAQGVKGKLMHNKFCIIDMATVINGSYNWSYRARQNHENITVSREAAELAGQFLAEFRRLKTRYFSGEGGQAPSVDAAQVMKRLSLIKNLIELNELEDLPLQLAKLPSNEPELEQIRDALRFRRYSVALPAIQAYISSRNQIAKYVDPEMEGLRLEAQVLELQVTALSNELAELEQLLYQFQLRHRQELGPLIIQILRLKEEQANTDEERARAKAEREEYEEDYERDRGEHVYPLSDEEQVDIKNLFRQATKLCHPDVVSTEYREEATQWFISLKDAYDHNDLSQVKEILERLERGTAFGSMLPSLTDVERLRSWVQEYRSRIAKLTQEIVEIKDSEEYRTIVNIADWEVYFSGVKAQLEAELTELANE